MELMCSRVLCGVTPQCIPGGLRSELGLPPTRASTESSSGSRRVFDGPAEGSAVGMMGGVMIGMIPQRLWIVFDFVLLPDRSPSEDTERTTRRSGEGSCRSCCFSTRGATSSSDSLS